MATISFPKDFLWGSATSAYQVEGGIDNNDWAKKYPAGRACDQYNLYEQDFDLLKKLYQNAYRFSIEWSRIEPKEGEFDEAEIEHYRKVLLALQERGITPVVTLWHWTLPLWFEEKGGWASKEAVEDFKRYTRRVVEELGDLVEFWITLNEPMNHVGLGYIAGAFPPHKKNIFVAWRVLKNLEQAHREAYHIIRGFDMKAQVSISKIINDIQPAHPKFFLDRIIAQKAYFWWNTYFLSKIIDHVDFIGFSYYFHNRVTWYPPFQKKAQGKMSDLGWEIHPEGIYHVLQFLKKYQKPIYILENGLADEKDVHRAQFITDHLQWVHKAIESGVNVKGYFHWSLLDNFEWKEGFAARFGLVEMDFETMKRTPRKSAEVYSEICKNNGLDSQ